MHILYWSLLCFKFSSHRHQQLSLHVNAAFFVLWVRRFWPGRRSTSGQIVFLLSEGDQHQRSKPKRTTKGICNYLLPNITSRLTTCLAPKVVAIEKCEDLTDWIFNSRTDPKIHFFILRTKIYNFITWNDKNGSLGSFYRQLLYRRLICFCGYNHCTVLSMTTIGFFKRLYTKSND